MEDVRLRGTVGTGTVAADVTEEEFEFASAQPPHRDEDGWVVFAVTHAISTVAVAGMLWGQRHECALTYEVHVIHNAFVIASMLLWTLGLATYRTQCPAWLGVAGWMAIQALLSTLESTWRACADDFPTGLKIYVALYVTQAWMLLWGLKRLVVE